MHRAGFVNIIGNPNVGKSTLMNAFIGEKLSIITSKAQTTRHRILGIVNGDDFQMILSDTPGIIKPAYELQSSMMDFVKSAFEDADTHSLLGLRIMKQSAISIGIGSVGTSATPILHSTCFTSGNLDIMIFSIFVVVSMVSVSELPGFNIE